MAGPFFSVVIPTYNRSGLIEETLQSVFAQTFSDYEVIVIDDGSTDGSSQVIGRYGQKVHFMRQSNQGPGAARNLGIVNAKGRYIAFLDSDDLWFPWTLSSYHGVICENEGPSFVCGCAANICERSTLICAPTAKLRYTFYKDYLCSSKERIWIGTCSVAIRADVIRAVGGFQSQNLNAEDSDLWLKLGCAHGFVRILSPSLFCYRSTPNSAITQIDKTYFGMKKLMDSEINGFYPGGLTRRSDRLRILSRHLRPASFGLLKAHKFGKAFELYRVLFRWHCGQIRVKYLLGFPLLLIYEMCRKNRMNILQVILIYWAMIILSE